MQGTIHLRRRQFVGGEGSKIGQICRTAAINELLCMKNVGAQIAMDFS